MVSEVLQTRTCLVYRRSSFFFLSEGLDFTGRAVPLACDIGLFMSSLFSTD